MYIDLIQNNNPLSDIYKIFGTKIRIQIYGAEECQLDSEWVFHVKGN